MILKSSGWRSSILPRIVASRRCDQAGTLTDRWLAERYDCRPAAGSAIFNGGCGQGAGAC